MTEEWRVGKGEGESLKDRMGGGFDRTGGKGGRKHWTSNFKSKEN